MAALFRTNHTLIFNRFSLRKERNEKLLIALLFGFCANVNADHYYRNITITGAGIYGSGGQSILFVDFIGDKAGMAACATTKADTKVDILVNDSCNYWGNAEDIAGIKMGDMPW